jgi:peptidoglycan/xylan/chitin deacetylase (PgdA/CDA1 family)
VSTPSDALRATFAFLLLPLSLVPLYFALPRIRAEVGPEPDRAPLAVPVFAPTKAQYERWKPLPPARNAIPVLAYHGINDDNDHYSVSSDEFAEQMGMLRRAGFESITIADYVRFLQGVDQDLPERPILITFDDGRLDSYRGADKVLAENGFRATMFAIVGHTEEHSSFYLNRGELRWMMKSGRWDVQEHAGVMHENVAYDAAGNTGPAYAYRQYRDGEGLESFADFKHRVRQDILWAKSTLSEELPGYMPWAFAVPFGSYGNDGTNDRRIPGFMRRLLQRNFQAVFMTEPSAYSTPKSARAALPRFEIHGDTRTDDLYRWLRDRMPARPVEREPLTETPAAVSVAG